MTRRPTADVLIIGAGPAGLLLAVELAAEGVDTLVVERDARRPRRSRGFTLNARSLDLLARRGLAAPFLAEGHPAPHAPSVGLPVTADLDGAATDHPFTLGIPQLRVEEILEEHALAHGARLLRGHRLDALRQDADGTTARVTADPDGPDEPDGPVEITAAFAVGCDGGRSTVRKQAGIGFPGTPATTWTLLGDVVPADPADLTPGPHTGPGGTVFVLPRPGYVRAMLTDPAPPDDPRSPVTPGIFAEALEGALGRPVPLADHIWLTRFGDAARLADRYRDGRVLLAGDAAHIHPPAGAIGVNVALEDAHNLGWKLARTVQGTAPDALLDTYEAERRPAAERVLAHTRAQALLNGGDPGLRPLADLLTHLVSRPGGPAALAETLLGLDTRHPMGADDPGAHPWLGRLAPDLDLVAEGRRVRLSELVAGRRALLVALNGADAPEGAREAGVRTVRAHCAAAHGAAALLLRPDGHTAWVRTADGRETGDLGDAVARWCGKTDGGVPEPAARLRP
ncbi:FAD-dependent monooxygenase [Nocardiopsis sp. RSe5-2]|uniref:FAD-dependent monooxygenase n=1 Tax=Nocardiopsis endophytica TaxID=3018445 RepID=A0ABT4U3K1_9ACTN|nr:FAD-dependent monooxygenase [Nocardiopsis endophytica]MDA2811510.1 FAD-dependent monooxygenase [Nocardiopsis endophytica]